MVDRNRIHNEFLAPTTDETNTMQSKKNYICPRCEYPLIPVHSTDGPKRSVIALSCPEPYCDHMQMVPRSQATSFEAEKSAALRKAAN